MSNEYPAGYTPMTGNDFWRIYMEVRRAVIANEPGFEKYPYETAIERAVLARLPKPDAEPVAWITHHDEPMLFPTYDEALSFCDDDETPIPLYDHPPKPDHVPDAGKMVSEAGALLADVDRWLKGDTENPIKDAEDILWAVHTYLQSDTAKREASVKESLTAETADHVPASPEVEARVDDAVEAGRINDNRDAERDALLSGLRAHLVGSGE